MATRFVRIDLSDEARDFRAIALEPGVPLLDRSGANSRLLFRWLGGLAAEPVWEGDSVNFYVRDDHGGRLEEAVCQPATDQDLQTLLKDDMAALKGRLEKARPETSTEKAVHRKLLDSLRDLTENPDRTDQDNFFFRYRDVQNRWRLVWCWGYQRRDQTPAAVVICTDPDCNLLFVRRPGQSPKCPSCEQLLARQPARKSNWKRAVLVGLLLFLLGAGLVWWLTRPNKLIATPMIVTGPAGSRVECKVVKTGLFRNQDVTRQAVGVVQDPSVARFDQLSATASLRRPGGNTVIQFYWGDLRTAAPVTVAALGNPEKIVLEPDEVKLGVGTTARLKLIGHYKDGNKADLSEAAEWKPLNDGVVFAADGLVEGLAQGAAKVSARYRAAPDSPYLDATAEVTVRKIDFQSLEVGIDPLPVALGRGSQLRLDAVAADGKRYSILESSQARATVDPPERAIVYGRQLKGERLGQGKLAVAFGEKLTADKTFTVAAAPGLDRLVVTPEPPAKMELAVGEIADLNIVTPRSDPVKVTSSSPELVEVTPGNRLIGRKVGDAKVEVAQGGEKCTVDVVVVPGEFDSIAIQPGRVVVPVDEAVRPRVMGRLKGDAPRTAEVAPDQVACDKAPSPRYVDFNAKSLELRGVKPTEPSARQTLALRVGKNKATADVEVTAAPLQLELVPAGTVKLPSGQQMRLQAWANYSGGRRVQVPNQRVEWLAENAAATSPGLELRGDQVTALKPGGGPLPVYARYLGRESNRVTFNSVEAEGNLGLRLKTDRPSHAVGENGWAAVKGIGPGQSDIDLVPGLAKYKSSDDKILRIDEKTGSFRALTPGEVSITATHPASNQTAELRFRVGAQAGDKGERPVAVNILSDQPVLMPVGAACDDFRVEAKYPDGITRQVRKKATLRTPDSADKSIVTAERGRLLGIRPGKTTVSAEFEGVKAEKPLEVEVLEKIDVDKIVLRPAPLVIQPTETAPLQAIGYKGSQPVGDLGGLSGMKWESDNAAVARVAGGSVTGVANGQTKITAEFNAVKSQPADVIVGPVADPLKVDPQVLRLRVGEGVQLGTGLTVLRGDVDVSRQCSVQSASPGIVRYVPETNTLVGVAPGTTPITVALGDKLGHAVVDVLPSGGPIDGTVVVEPASTPLAVGQAQPLRVYVVTAAGDRIDRTDSAVLTSSDPKAVAIQGDRACAMQPGTAEVTASVSGAKETGKAYVNVSNDEIAELTADPAELVMSVGDVRRLKILGRAAPGTHEMFPQADLKLAAAGESPAAIKITNHDVEGVKPGQAAVDISWRDRVKQRVPVTVTDSVWTDLRLEPARATVHPGQAIKYEASAVRGGQRRVLGPENGLRLTTDRQDVAQVIEKGMDVLAKKPGTTAVVAQLGTNKVEAALDVTRGERDVVIVGPADDWVRSHGDRRRHGPGGGYHGGGYWDGDHWVEDYGDGGVVAGPRTDLTATGLRFLPDRLSLGTTSPPAGVRVCEVLSDGSDGRDVTADPNLVLESSSDVAIVEKAKDGPAIRPAKPGEARITAKLDKLSSAAPLLVQVGDQPPAVARLIVAPDPLVLWSGETGRFDSVRVDPGNGQEPVPIESKIGVPDNQATVAIDPKGLRGLSVGTVQVKVIAADDSGPYAGLSGTATVKVIPAEKLVIEPADLRLQVNEKTPPVAVMAQADDGSRTQVDAKIESADPNVLALDPDAPGQFTAKALGRTQLRATYRGAEATASVTITGNRFVDVQPVLNAARDDFDVTVNVQAAGSEGELEYRVYKAGDAPPNNWTAAKKDGDALKVELRSPRIPYDRDRDALYHLMIEARDPAGKSVQQYPYTFRLRQTIERKDQP